ncbi:phosphotransferase [Streptomyces sp. NBC_01708]|uniref:phosphotransferase n=1 Tax=Streptomyces sp. NBC_01708 TaxID=2975915 RepID=UPI002E2EF2DB|nr:phosphotransferase [Streptomyces sp. NBC_01708]
MPQPATSARDLDVVRPPTPDLVAAYASEQIMAAARALWPAATVQPGRIIPSVTSHVQRIDVGTRPLYAKVELLGVSLVSVLRGSCGNWPTVKAAQAAYLRSSRALLVREGAHLRALAAAGLRVPDVAGYSRGVLFTERIQGATLDDVIAAEPARTPALLQLVHRALDPVLRQRDVMALADRAPIVERSITGTFLRKFNGLSGPTYLSRSPHGDVLRLVVARLRSHHTVSSMARPIVFGDLKPEHILFTTGDPRPAFIDPGLMRGPLCADPAKLMSRLALGLVARQPPAAETRAVLDGMAAYTADATAHHSTDEEDAWLRQLIDLWLMDTTNILTTYLTNPPDLPLSPHGAAVAARAGAVCQMLDLSSRALAARHPARHTWNLCLANAAQAAAL